MNKFQNFIELPIFNDEYVYGTNKSLPFIVINKEGEWRQHLQIPEDQYKNGFESQSCITFSTLDAGVEILQEAQYGILKQNYSERYISTLSGTTPQGNSPHRVAETIRRYGLIPEEVLPFDSTVDTWNEYFDTEKVEALKCEGKKWLREWDFKHEWIITKQTAPHLKKEIIERFLKVSPVGVSVCAWYDDGRGGYYRPDGLKDNHFCVIVGQDAEYFYIADTYAPYLKRVSKNYDFMYAKRYMLTRREKTLISFIHSLWK